MVKGIYFYETLKNSFSNFLRIKKFSVPEIIHEMAENPGNFIEKEYVIRPENLNKVTMSFNGNKKDWDIIEDFLLECNFSEVFGQMVFNYMYIHKDDEPRTKKGNGKVLSVYLSHEDWEKLDSKRGDKSVSTFIKEFIRE